MVPPEDSVVSAALAAVSSTASRSTSVSDEPVAKTGSIQLHRKTTAKHSASVLFANFRFVFFACFPFIR